MNLDHLQASRFMSGGTELAFYMGGTPDGFPVMLIHGFASTAHVNWVFPGWFKTLGEAGYRVLALDNRGHGMSDKPRDPAAYGPAVMAGDARALLDELNIASAHVMGYSMGARIAAFFALAYPDRARSIVLGGLGLGLVEGVGDWNPIADALLAPTIDDVSHPRARMFRAFADQTGSDRIALAACIRGSRTELSRADVGAIDVPALIAVGTKDDIAGPPSELARLMPLARVLDIPNRDHMLSVGDKLFKSETLRFFSDVESGIAP